MPRTDHARRLIDAPVHRVFPALVERAALETWLPPAGMTGRVEHHEPQPGGRLRIVLTYDDATDAPGKSSADADIVEARYVDIVEDHHVVFTVGFVADDPAFAGTMTMTWSVTPIDDRTLVEFVAHDVPDGISAEDHATGLASSLAQLASYVTR